jgi:hypothetical protein
MVVVAFAVVLAALTGCIHHTYNLAPSKVQIPGTERLLGVTTVAGQELMFDKRAAQTVMNDTIFTTVNDTARAIPLSQVQRVWVRRVDPGLTLLAVIGATLLSGLLLVSGALTP